MGDLSDYYFATSGIDELIDAQMTEEVKQRQREIWTTRDGREIPIRQMEETHLLNSLRQIRAQGIKVGHHVHDALAAEVKRRGLEPLPDFSCVEEAKATAAVSALYMHWRRLPQQPKEVRERALSNLKAFLHDDWLPTELFLLSTQDKNERGVYAALVAYSEYGAAVDEEAKKRLAEVFSRWTVAMKIDELIA